MYIYCGDYMKISDLSNNDKPREKLIKYGAASLSDIELLAIMISSGTKEESVLELSSRIINEYGFKRLLNMNYRDLVKIKGINIAKATKLQASFEIAKRALKIDDNISIKTSIDLYNYVKEDYLFAKYEILEVIYVNKKCMVIDKRRFDNFSLTNVFVPIRKIVDDALSLNAYGLFMVHNHPSGDLSPSENDLDTYMEYKNILMKLDIKFFDSLIVSYDNFFSIDNYLTSVD